MKIKKYFVTGLIVLLPVIVSIYIMVTLFKFADGILGKYLNVYLEKAVGFYVPGMGFVLTLLIVISAGFISTYFIGRKMSSRIEKWFCSLPMIDKIYPVLKQIISFAVAQEEFGFKKVVLVEYPSKGIWSIGFVTNEKIAPIDKAVSSELLAVFIPTTPGPLTGYVVFIPKNEVKFPELSVNDALKLIISGGFIKV